MNKDISSNMARISGKFEVEKPIELGEDVELVIKASCCKIETFDNQDGSVDQVYILKPLEVNRK
jgi:hypothetical protein